MGELVQSSRNFELESYYQSVPLLREGGVINDRFHVLGMMGAGAQARIFDAVDADTQSRVALKVPLIGKEDEEARFIREIEVTKGLSAETEGVVNFIDAGVSNDYRHPFLFMATENLQGGSLAKILKNRNGSPLTLADTKSILTPVSEGLVVTAKAGLVHRDLKPENVFTNKKTQGRMGDFGVVSIESLKPVVLENLHISPDVVANDITPTETAVGSFSTIPPEVVTGEKGYTSAADVFALGSLLHNCLTGRSPLRKTRSIVEHQMYMENEYTPPSMEVYDDRVPAELAKLAIAALDRDPNSRPKPQEYVEALSAL